MAFDEVENPLLSDSPSVWDELIESVGPASLLVIIRSRLGASLGRRVTEEDIFQESLLCAWRDRTKLEWRGIKSFRSWLLTIIDHRIRDAAARESAQKRGGRSGPVLFSHFESESAGNDGTSFVAGLVSTTPSRIAMYKEQATAIEQALTCLPADLQTVVQLRLIEQRSVEEVAALLGIGPSAVRHRLYRGAELYRTKLREQYQSLSYPHVPIGGGASGTDPATF